MMQLVIQAVVACQAVGQVCLYGTGGDDGFVWWNDQNSKTKQAAV